MKDHKSQNCKALIMGGSLAGLLAARVLSDFYKEVTIIERDSLDTEDHRRGVPQSRHAHGLLAGGLQVIEEFFPGITNAMVDDGAVRADVANDGRWFFEGRCLSRAPSGNIGILLSRPLLENSVRKRVREIQNVSILDNRSVRHLTSLGSTVTGVRTEDEVLKADLVVDASGRGSKTPIWLESLRFSVPREEAVEINIAYTSRFFHRNESDLGGDAFAAIPADTNNKHSGVILAQEQDRWIVTLIGRGGIQPPQDLPGFTDYAKTLPASFIHDVVRHAEPIGDAMSMRFPTSVRRRYEELRRFPKGFLVFGDAICSFNPVYGQGMSVAALQAKAMQRQLLKGEGDLAARFFRDAAKTLDAPWNIAVGADLKMPETVGKRTRGGKFIGWYISRLHRLAHYNAGAANAFLRVTQLLDDPSTLFRPSLALKVLAAHLANSLGNSTLPVEETTRAGSF